jgi:hypothetical protein
VTHRFPIRLAAHDDGHKGRGCRVFRTHIPVSFP